MTHVDSDLQKYQIQDYNKSLFTLSFIVGNQLRKYVEEFETFVNEIAETNYQQLKQKQKLMRQSLHKFKKHFEHNLTLISNKETQY